MLNFRQNGPTLLTSPGAENGIFAKSEREKKIVRKCMIVEEKAYLCTHLKPKQQKEIMKYSKLVLLGAMMAFSAVEAQVTPTVQMEPLTRGVMAMPAQGRGIYVSWRLLGTDDAKTTTFNLLRDGKLIARNICGRTNFVDPNGTVDNQYQVVTLVNGQEVATSEAVNPWTDKYKVVQLDLPAGGVDYGRCGR